MSDVRYGTSMNRATESINNNPRTMCRLESYYREFLERGILGRIPSWSYTIPSLPSRGSFSEVSPFLLFVPTIVQQLDIHHFLYENFCSVLTFTI